MNEMNEIESAGRVLYLTQSEMDAQRVKAAGGYAATYKTEGLKELSAYIADKAPEVLMAVFVLDPYDHEVDTVIDAAKNEFIYGAAA